MTLAEKRATDAPLQIIRPTRRAGMSELPAPRIYVASLSDYVNGRLHGCWIDATQPMAEIWAEKNAMLAASPEPGAEEWAIHDFDGFGPLALGEYENIEQVARIACGIIEHGEAFAHWAQELGPERWENDLDAFADCYFGHWATRADWARDFLDASGIVPDEIGPEIIQPYVRVDLDALARDLSCDFVVSDGRDGIYVFTA